MIDVSNQNLDEINKSQLIKIIGEAIWKKYRLINSSASLYEWS